MRVLVLIRAAHHSAWHVCSLELVVIEYRHAKPSGQLEQSAALQIVRPDVHQVGEIRACRAQSDEIWVIFLAWNVQLRDHQRRRNSGFMPNSRALRLWQPRRSAHAARLPPRMLPEPLCVYQP